MITPAAPTASTLDKRAGADELNIKVKPVIDKPITSVRKVIIIILSAPTLRAMEARSIVTLSRRVPVGQHFNESSHCTQTNV